MRHPIVVTLLLLGCGDGPPAEAGDTSPAETPPPAAQAPPAFSTFDPGAIAPGDTLFGLSVAATDLTQALEDSIWVGSVVFEGDLVLHGVYQRHPDWPQIELPCVHVVQPPSIARIPRFPADAYTGPDPKTWFCIENAEVALELLGTPEPPREVVIAVARYRVVRELSDVFDTATLAEVIEVGPAATATLLEP
jgi:hypothetical protein